MTAEAPEKRIENPKTKDIPGLISVATAQAAARMAKQIAEQKPPDQKLVGNLVANVGNDLKQEGLPVEKSDYKAVMKQAEEAFARSSGAYVPPPVELPDIPEGSLRSGLEEYRAVVGELFDTYKLGNSNWQAITAIYGTTDFVGNMLGGFQTKPWISEESRKALSDKVEKGLEYLQARQTPFSELGKKVWNLPPDAKKKGFGLLLSAGWPWIAGVAHWFVGRRAEKLAHTLTVSETAKLSRAINTRIADSLFMREFEFLHDKPAGEMMRIIEDGKISTLDLINTTYTQFLPTLLGLVSQLPRQYITGKLEFISTLVKMPFLLMRSEKNAKLMQKNRALELAQMDKVNTKLMTTLSGLESARTAGSATVGAQSMYDMLAERDFIAGHGLRQKLARNRQMNLLFDAMDIGLPLLTEAWKFRQDVTKSGVTSEDAFQFGLSAASRIINSKDQQLAMRGAFAGLTSMYVDSVVRDIQDIRRMEELLGKYDTLDRPGGPKERARIPVSGLPNTNIHIENVGYKGIIRNISLDIPQGAFVTIKGESGTGKTTLIRNLVGLYTPDAGAVNIGGVAVDKIRKYGREALTTIVGYANQNPQILEGMTLRENLLLWSQKKVPEAVLTQVLKNLRLEHLTDRLDTTTKHFSGGELKRIGIARALLKNPRILILDEPTASLDEESARQVMSIIQDLRKSRPDMTVVAITHDPIFERISENIIDFTSVNKRETKPQSITQPTLSDHQVLEAIARPK